MGWIDLKSGVVLAGSLVVLAGSIESRLHRRVDEGLENPEVVADPEGLKNPEGARSADVPKNPEEPPPPVMATGRDIKPLKPFSWRKPGPPKASA